MSVWVDRVCIILGIALLILGLLQNSHDLRVDGMLLIILGTKCG